MKKIANKKAAVLLTCLVVALAGCGEADKTDTTPTPVPTTEAATAPRAMRDKALFTEFFILVTFLSDL